MSRNPRGGAHCTICPHPQRVRIERTLANGAAVRSVAHQFGVGYHSVWRHWRNHVSAEQRARYSMGPGATLEKLAKQVADENITLVDHYRIIRAQLYAGFDAASAAGDRLTLDRLAGRLHENLRDCARLTGEIQRGTFFVQNNIAITQDPGFAQAVAAIVCAVSPYPEARRAVISALRDLEAPAGAGAVIDPLAPKLIGAAHAA